MSGKYPLIALALIIAAYILLAAAYALGPGLGKGPDEPAHFIYVREIGSHFRMPVLAHDIVTNIDSRMSHEAHQPFLYYAMAAVPYRAAALLGADTDTIWRVLRLFTALFGGFWIFFVYKLASEFFGRRTWAAVFSATLPGLLPLPVYMGGVVSNDIPASMFFTATLWLIIRSVRNAQLSGRDALWIGVWGGLAILAKAQGIFLIPTLVTAACVVSACRKWQDARAMARNTTLAVFIMLVIGSIWFGRNMAVYGTPVIQSLHTPPQIWSLLSVTVVLNQMFEHFWTPVWILQNFVGMGVYLLMPVFFCALVLLGLFIYMRRDYMQSGDRVLAHEYSAWVLLFMPLVFIAASLVYLTLSVDFGMLQGGRLVLPGAGGLGIAATAALQAVTCRPGARKVLGVLVVLGVIIADILVLAMTAYYYSML